MKVGICGLGTVGAGVVNVFARNSGLLSQRIGRDIEIAHIGARRDNPNCDTSGIRVSRDIFDVVKDPDIDIVIELIGGTDVAKAVVCGALNNGKHVVTANKALIAECGNEIFALAARQNKRFMYEAAVAGGIPIIKVLREGLAANRVQSLVGIINGTGNFILSEMSDANREFADALADAQRLGYAEADPTFDIEGIDAAQKLAILGALAFGIPIDAEACFTEGISALSTEDIVHARELGYALKHLGIARWHDQGLELRVHPSLLPADKLLSQINGVMNAVNVTSDALGSTLYYGAGAGAEATASAVLADVGDLARSLVDDQSSRVDAALSVASDAIPIVDIDDVVCPFYLRINAYNKVGVLSDITQLLGRQSVSVEAVLQRDMQAKGETADIVPIVLITNAIAGTSLRKAVSEIERLDGVAESVTVIRVENID